MNGGAQLVGVVPLPHCNSEPASRTRTRVTPHSRCRHTCHAHSKNTCALLCASAPHIVAHPPSSWSSFTASGVVSLPTDCLSARTPLSSPPPRPHQPLTRGAQHPARRPAMADQAEITPGELKFRCERGCRGWQGPVVAAGHRCLTAASSTTTSAAALPAAALLGPCLPPVQLNKQLPAAISIHNPTGERLAFKVGRGAAIKTSAASPLPAKLTPALCAGRRSRPQRPRSMWCAPAR